MGAAPIADLPGARWAWPGWVGVQIFFVISGFVIAFSAQSSTPLAFARGRLERLFPLIWACASITLVVGLLWPDPVIEVGVNRWLRTVLLAPRGPWIDDVYWSLTVELTFYTVVFALMAWRDLGDVLPAMTLVGLASCALPLALFALARVAPGCRVENVLRTIQGSGTATLLLLNHGLYFLLGMLVERASRMRLTGGQMALAALCTLAAVVQIEDQAARWYASEAAMVPALIWTASIALLVLAVRFGRVLDRWPAPVLGAIRTAGLLTYPLYLLHDKAGVALQLAALQAGVPPAFAIALPAAASLAAAYVAMRVMEPPLRRLLHALLLAAARSAGRLQRTMFSRST
jgi:peptidoglycan/LPS O-acetylase OafA/YrhL